MAARTIAVTITLNNRDAIANTRAQTQATKDLSLETQKISMLQAGLTNSFIKGNLAARAISVSYLSIRDAVGFAVGGMADLELVLAKVQAVTGASGETTKQLAETIFQLGRETSSSTADISKASLELAKLGFSGKELEIILGGVSRLSSVLGDSLESTGQLVGGVINAFDLSAEQATTVADKLFVATGKSAASIESFRTAFGLAGNVAANAGVSFEELAAVIATLSNQGIKASTIGTGLRTWITNLGVEGSKAQKALGGSVEELGLLGSMQKMAELKPDAGSIFEMFGKPGSPVATAMAGSIPMFEEFTKAVKGSNDELNKGGAIINDTLLGSITRLKNATVELFSVWGVAPMGAMKTFFSTLAGGLQSISDMGKLSDRVAEFRKKDPMGATRAEQEAFSKTNVTGGLLAFSRFATGREGIDDQAMSETTQFRLFEAGIERKKQQILLQEKMQKEMLALLAPNKAGTNTIDFKAMEEAEKKAAEFKKFMDDEKYDIKPVSGMMVDERNAMVNDRGDTYKEVFDAKRAKEKEQADTKKWGEDYSEFQRMITQEKEYAKFVLETSLVFHAMSVGINATNGSLQLFSNLMVDTLSGSKSPLDNFTNAFGDFSKKIAADLITLTLKFALFKIITTSLGIGTGGFGFAGGSGLLGAFLQGLGGQSQKFASGTDQVVSQPTMFMAGESGRERVTVTPRAKMGSSGGGITVNIQGDVMDGAKFTEAVEMAQKRLRGRNV